jgi:hypothetical protein
VIGFIIFRANDLTQAVAMLRSLITPSAYRHLEMARNFYLLVVAVAASYFVFTAITTVLRTWRRDYLEAASGRAGVTTTAASRWIADVPMATGAVVDFAAARVWWWLGPAVVSVMVLVALAVYVQQAVVTVTPFIYTLF